MKNLSEKFIERYPQLFKLYSSNVHGSDANGHPLKVKMYEIKSFSVGAPFKTENGFIRCAD